MSLTAFLETLQHQVINAVCLTNHGNLKDYEDLVAMAPHGIAIIPGVELSSTSGDFLVFSVDLDFLRSLNAVQLLPKRGDRPSGTAVVWAHPFAGNRGGRGVDQDYISSIVAEVDGIEVYNGNWPDEEASGHAFRIAEENGLAQLGGSDAHRVKDLMRCWTEADEKICTGADLVAAIIGRKTTAKRK